VLAGVRWNRRLIRAARVQDATEGLALELLAIAVSGGASLDRARSGVDRALADVPARLEALGMLAGLPPEALARQAVSAFDAVLHVERTATGRRLAALGGLQLDRRGRLAVLA
jgi:hypothetical protein